MSKRRRPVPPKPTKPEANTLPAYYVAITTVDGTTVWRGVVDDANISFSMKANPEKVTIHAKSLASYLRAKVAKR